MLEKMKDEILGLPEEEKRALAALHDTARERQKQKFLEGFFIDVASIPGVAELLLCTLCLSDCQ